MKNIENLLEMLCVVLTVVFFLAVAVMVFGQAICVATLNGASSVYLSDMIAEPASIVAAVSTIVAMLLAYIRGQMRS